MINKVIFWGATGQAKVLRELVERLGRQVAAVFDNDPAVPSPFADVPIFYGKAGFEEWRRKQTETFGSLVAIGGHRGKDRLELQNFLNERGFSPVTAAHPRAFVAESAALAAGCQILAGACVCVEAKLGAACIVNTGATVDHESILGDGVHVGPGAHLAGCVRAGDFTMIGAGAVVLPRVVIGRQCLIGAGAVVTRDVPDGKVVWGNPARIRRKHVT